MQEKDKIIIIDNYYIIDYNIDAKEKQYIIRNYWNIEYGLDWRLGAIMKEHYSKNKKGILYTKGTNYVHVLKRKKNLSLKQFKWLLIIGGYQLKL